MRRSTRRLGSAFGGFNLRSPPAETLGRLGPGAAAGELAVDLALSALPLSSVVQPTVLGLGILLLDAGLISSLVRGRGAGGGARSAAAAARCGAASASPTAARTAKSWLSRLRRMFRGR